MFIKNVDIIDRTFLGQFIAVGGFYQIQPEEYNIWKRNGDVYTALTQGEIKLSTIGSDSGLIDDITTGIYYFKNTIPSYDTSSPTLELNKKAKIESIDYRTTVLIGAGFTYDSKQFSLSMQAQNNWNTIKNSETEFTWPVDITTIDNDTYSLAQANLSAFWIQGKDTVKVHLDSGRILKKSVIDSVDQAALDLVVDNR